MPDERHQISDLLTLMARLRHPETGCPWDRAQSYETIVPCTIEECYELAAAIEEGDYDHVREELGDVLFQVVFYAQLAAEEERFDFADVVDVLVSKLLRRHPHVFADGTLTSGPPERVHDTHEIKANWESIKAAERIDKKQHGTLADVPVNLPALSRAQKIQKRAANVGFDWPDTAGPMEKLREELREVEQAMSDDSVEKQLQEIGDLLFSCVNLIRHLGGDAESVLRGATTKFEKRFLAMEADLESRGLSAEEADLEQMDAAWNRIKS